MSPLSEDFIHTELKTWNYISAFKRFVGRENANIRVRAIDGDRSSFETNNNLRNHLR